MNPIYLSIETGRELADAARVGRFFSRESVELAEAKSEIRRVHDGEGWRSGGPSEEML